MHFKEDVEVECSEALRLVEVIEESIGINLCRLLGCRLYCIQKDDLKKIFCISRELEEFIKSQGAIDRIVHFGVLVGTSSGKELKPSIQLALLLSMYKYRINKGKAILYGKAALRFVHGKPVRRRFRVLGESKFYLVFNEKGDPLGWGYITNSTLYPYIDVGWFLRAGG